MSGFSRRGACPALSAPMQTGDGLLARLNPLAGEVSPLQLAGLAQLSEAHGNGILEVTARGSLQFRGLSADSASQLADGVETLGIEARTDVPVETGPLSGLDPNEIENPGPLAAHLREEIARTGLRARLGPKVSVIVDGGGLFSLDAILADVRLVAERRGGDAVWRLGIGGDAATARDIGTFDEAGAVEAAMAVLHAVAKRGLDARAKDLRGADGARMFSSATPASGLPDRGAAGGRRPLGILNLGDDTYALTPALPFGSMEAKDIGALARAAELFGATAIRPAPPRCLVVLGLDETACRRLDDAARALGFITDPADPRLSIAACPGVPACASGLIAARDVASEIAQAEPGLFDGSFTLHVSGCGKGCAHPARAAITVTGTGDGAAFVFDGTAGGLPAGMSPRYEAGHGLMRLARLVRAERRPAETTSRCLARLGAQRLAQAVQPEGRS